MTSAAGPRPRATGDQQRSAGGKVADVFVVFGITGDLAKVSGGFGDGHKHVLVTRVGDLEGENQRRAPVGPHERIADGTQAAILRLEEPAST